MPSKFLYVQYTDLGRRSHVCLHSPESCFLRQKKFICLGSTNLACEMMIRRFISVKREKTRSDPKGASQLQAKGILKKHRKKNQTRLQRKEPGDEVKKESPWWMLSAPDPLPLNPHPLPLFSTKYAPSRTCRTLSQGWRGARGTPQSYLPVCSRKQGIFIYLPAKYLQTDN